MSIFGCLLCHHSRRQRISSLQHCKIVFHSVCILCEQFCLGACQKRAFPFPKVSPWRWRNQNYIVSSNDYQPEFSNILRSCCVLSFFQYKVQMLIKALQSATEALAAFESYEHDLSEVLLKDFSRHFAHYSASPQYAFISLIHKSIHLNLSSQPCFSKHGFFSDTPTHFIVSADLVAACVWKRFFFLFQYINNPRRNPCLIDPFIRLVLF